MLFYLYTDAGNPKFSDYIFIWEENGKIVGCILPDGDQYTNEEDKGSACNLGFCHKKI